MKITNFFKILELFPRFFKLFPTPPLPVKLEIYTGVHQCRHAVVKHVPGHLGRVLAASMGQVRDA